MMGGGGSRTAGGALSGGGRGSPGAAGHGLLGPPGGPPSASATGIHAFGDEPPVRWVRVPTAPSIPNVNQSYGYEEGDAGELILQRPVKLG